jgi:hypothetical protein
VYERVKVPAIELLSPHFNEKTDFQTF